MTRFWLAHGGKDRHRYPVPVEVYDKTIEVLKSVVAGAKLGNEDRLEWRWLDEQGRRIKALERSDHPIDQGTLFGLLGMFTKLGALASIATHKAGAPETVATRVGEVTLVLCAHSASAFLHEHGIKPAASDPNAMTWPHRRLCDAVNSEGLRS